MKKPVAILVLILSGAAIIAVTSAITMLFFLILAAMIPAGGSWALYTAAAMFLLMASYPMTFMREYYRRYQKINSAVFTVCFCAPSFIAAEAANLLYTPPENSDSVVPIETILLFWLVITAVFTFWMIVHACVEAYKKHRDKNG